MPRGGGSSVRAMQEPQARVTVLIPTYNRAEWLGGAIESALAQTWTDFRIVVSDNASTDATADVVAAFDDPRITYRRLERNIDLNAHYNFCYAGCDTEYVCALPDDDRFAPDFLERTVPVLDASPNVGVVHGQVTVIDREGAVIAPAHDMTGLPGDAIESGHDFIRASFDGSYRVHATTTLIRTEALRGVPLDHRDYPITDFGHWMRVALRWDMAFVAHPLASYRVHETSYTAGAADVTTGGYRQGADRVAKFHEIKLRLLEEHGGELGDVAELRRRAFRAFRRDLIVNAALVTPERRLGETVAVLRERIALEPRIALMPAAWRLLATGIIGPRGVAALKNWSRLRSMEVAA
jgi:glycosyltransferase involved in cell wall biosynthesis